MCFYRLSHCVIFNNTVGQACPYFPVFCLASSSQLSIPIEQLIVHRVDSNGCFFLVTCEKHIPDHNHFHSYLLKLPQGSSLAYPPFVYLPAYFLPPARKILIIIIGFFFITKSNAFLLFFQQNIYSLRSPLDSKFKESLYVILDFLSILSLVCLPFSICLFDTFILLLADIYQNCLLKGFFFF